MAERTSRFICSEGPAAGSRGSAGGPQLHPHGPPPTGTGCCLEAHWLALFDVERPLPLGPALDFLFVPAPGFLSQALGPALARLPAWRMPGPRMGVHLRTLHLDGR